MRRKLTAVFCLFFCFVAVMPVYAESVKLTEKQKATLDESVEALKKQRSTVNKTKNTISGIQNQINEYESTIDALNWRMEETQKQIKKLDVQLREQEKELEQRMCAMYMVGDDGYLELLFTADSFADLLTRVDQVRAVMKKDRECVDDIKRTKKKIESGIKDLENDKKNAEALKEKQELLKANYEALLATQQLQYDAEKVAADQLAKSMGLIGIDDYINELEWPFDQSLSAAFHISDWFGYRSPESTGGVGTTFHRGMDIIPGAGTPIMAVASGVVAKAEYNGGYGNCVVIEHGKNHDGKVMHSLYGHMSNFIVSVGEHVVQGDVIGYVGSTGPSTGAHLHLEIWENEQEVDPMNYFERYRDKMSFYG